MTKVTIILSTYNRPDALKHVIASVRAQSFENWCLLVVGDCCTPETAEVVLSFKDDRIYFYNTPVRCGEQSGPNSIGIGVAETEYLAFLNHDDYWLPNHLEEAVRTIEAETLDFYCSGAVLTTYARAGKNGQFRPAFAITTPQERTLDQIFYKSPVWLEPVSSWVMKTDYARAVGLWSPAATIFRSPIEDWLLRVWRTDGRIKITDTVSVLYCNAEKRKWVRGKAGNRGNLYDVGLTEAAFWDDYIARHGIKGLQTLMTSDLKSISRTASYFKDRYDGQDSKWLFDALVNADTAQVFRETGWDAFEKFSRLVSSKRGSKLGTMLKRRTGETLPACKSWQPSVDTARDQIAADPHWRKFCERP